MKTLGFLINPIAGMGGRVGLKGTDGTAILNQARELGAHPISQIRAEETMRIIYEIKPEVKWLTVSGEMGEKVLRKVGYIEEDFEVVYQAPDTTSTKDTESSCRQFKEKNVSLILFCGGDGTARDIYNIINKEIPILGIPSGVKMFSSVFGINPKAAAEVVLGFVNGTFTTSEAVDEETAKEDIARYVVELISEEKDTIFILGAGSTLEAIGKELGIEKTLLGVDVVKDGKLIGKDVNEEKLLQILDKDPRAQIIVGVIGAQGFVFGRGTQQISPEVIRKVGVDNIKIVATPKKMLNTKLLRVDTRDEEIDGMLSGHYKVIVGYKITGHILRLRKFLYEIISLSEIFYCYLTK
jgi:predicted polyphosphate/ATP-dependent NAD kinase